MNSLIYFKQSEKDCTKSDYERWIENIEENEEPSAAPTDGPLVSILMPVYNTLEKCLKEAIESVQNQIYPNWELCIADDASPDAHVKQILQKYEAEDKRIKVVYREENGHISKASNSALETASGEWIALLDHDDLLRSHALSEVVKVINKNPDSQIIYSDEDKIDEDRNRSQPYFKPDWNPDLLRGQNYFCHLSVYSAS